MAGTDILRCPLRRRGGPDGCRRGARGDELQQPRQWVRSGGRTPRFFAADPTGRFLHVVNEDGGTILRLDVAGGTGELTPAGEAAKTVSPVCTVFRDAV